MLYMFVGIRIEVKFDDESKSRDFELFPPKPTIVG